MPRSNKVLLGGVLLAASATLGAKTCVADVRWGPVPVYVANGLPVVSDNEGYSRAIPDGHGGTFIVWAAPDSFEEDQGLQIYGQHIGPDGKKLWNRSDPLLLVNEPGSDHGELDVVADGEGGFLVGYQKPPQVESHLKTAGPGPARQSAAPLFVQRFDGEGRALWPAPAAMSEDAVNYVLAPGGDGGVVGIANLLQGAKDQDVLQAFRVDGKGRRVYYNRLYDMPPGTSLLIAPLAVRGAAPGDYLFVLADKHLSARHSDVFAIHLAADGKSSVSRLSSGGAAGLFLEGPCARYVAAASDGRGGAFVAWVETERDGHSLRLTRVDGEGRVVAPWKPGGRIVDGDPKSYKFGLMAATDPTGGVFLQYTTRPLGSLARREGCDGCRKAWCDGATRFAPGGDPGRASNDLWLSQFDLDGNRSPAYLARVARDITQDQHAITFDSASGDVYSTWVDEPTRDVIVQKTDAGGRPRFGAGLVAGSYKGAGSLGITVLPAQNGGMIVAWKQSDRIYAQALSPDVKRDAPSRPRATVLEDGRVLWTWEPADDASTLSVISRLSGEVLAENLSPKARSFVQDSVAGAQEQIIVRSTLNGKAIDSPPSPLVKIPAVKK